MKKFCLIILIFLLILSICPHMSNAMGDIIKSADDFTKAGSSTALKYDEIGKVSDMLYNIFLSIGIIVAVVVAMILGIQFMTGSIEAKAKVKESLIPFVVGCVVIFGGFGIWKIVVLIGNKIA